MAGLTRDLLFRLETKTGILGRFRAVERARQRVALLGWVWERGVQPAGQDRGTIVLTDPNGAELRRWACGQVELEGERVLVTRIRREIAPPAP